MTPSPSLGLSFNNIGAYDFSEKVLSSCLRLLQNDEPFAFNGITQLEVNFAVVSNELGIIRLANTREFNPTNLLTAASEIPACSGQFETTTNTYTDVIETSYSYPGLPGMLFKGVITFEVNFKLYDGENLLFRLENFKELLPN